MKNIVKAIKKFDKNLVYFSNYCGNKNTLTHFLNYSNEEILIINNYEIKKNYFITPYLNFYPEGLITKHAIESLSVYLFENRLKFLLKTIKNEHNNKSLS